MNPGHSVLEAVVFPEPADRVDHTPVVAHPHREPTFTIPRLVVHPHLRVLFGCDEVPATQHPGVILGVEVGVGSIVEPMVTDGFVRRGHLVNRLIAHSSPSRFSSIT